MTGALSKFHGACGGLNIEHRTSNIEHRNAEIDCDAYSETSMFDVRCSTFDVQPAAGALEFRERAPHPSALRSFNRWK